MSGNGTHYVFSIGLVGCVRVLRVIWLLWCGRGRTGNGKVRRRRWRDVSGRVSSVWAGALIPVVQRTRGRCASSTISLGRPFGRYIVSLDVLEGAERGTFLCAMGEGVDIYTVTLTPLYRLGILFREPVLREFPLLGLSQRRGRVPLSGPFILRRRRRGRSFRRYRRIFILSSVRGTQIRQRKQ
jgi:hypothetical protein